MKKIIIGIVVLIIVVVLVVFNTQSDKEIKVGIVTPLTGDLAFWGEGTILGAELAVKDLKKEGIDITVIAEDGGLDPKKALDAGQKLLNIDKVQAMFPEFNPAAIALSSLLKGKNVLEIYDAAPISPLEENPDTFKTYIDYTVGCREVAEYIKDKLEVKTVGILEMNTEYSQLCTNGVEQVFGDDIYRETYNAGDQDLRTQLLRIGKHNPDAVFNASYSPENFTAIRNMHQLGMDNTYYVGASDTFPTNLVNDYKSQMDNKIIFGLPPVSQDFINKVKKEYRDKDIFAYEPVAIGYLHTMQMGRALHKCNLDVPCARKEISEVKGSDIIGFEGFENRIAKFEINISKWNGKEFETVK